VRSFKPEMLAKPFGGEGMVSPFCTAHPSGNQSEEKSAEWFNSRPLEHLEVGNCPFEIYSLREYRPLCHKGAGYEGYDFATPAP
jgi:hypothetical protein